MAQPSLPRAYWVLWTGTLVNRAGTFVVPFAVLYLTSARGYSAVQAGLVITVYGLGAAFSQLIGGWAADRIGRRATLAWGLAISALSLALMGAARGLPEICAAALLVGLAGDTYRPASSALVADLVPPDRRPRAYALIFWAVNLGFTVASVTAGFLAERSYTLLFVLDAATCLAYAGIVLVGIRHDPPRPPVPEGDAPGSFTTALRDPLMLALVGLTVATAVVYHQNAITLPLAITDDGLSPAVYGTVSAVNGLLIVLLQPWTIRWTLRFDRMRVLAAATALIGLGFGLTAFASTPLEYAGTVVVWTLGEIATAGLAVSLVADLAPVDARGRYQAVWGTSFGIAALLAPPLGTFTYQVVGPTALWAGCVVVGVLAALGYLALSPAAARRHARAVAVA
jgi:MFS family permease